MVRRMSKMLEYMQARLRGEIPPPAIGKLIGMSFTAFSGGRATYELEAGPQHANAMGTVHGGVFCDLADAAMGFALGTTLEDGETFTTLELHINYFKPIWSGKLRGEGRVVKRGRTVAVVECEITDPEGSLVARASSTCLILAGKAAEGRTVGGGSAP